MTAKPRNPRRWTENETSILCAAVEASRRDQGTPALFQFGLILTTNRWFQFTDRLDIDIYASTRPNE